MENGNICEISVKDVKKGEWKIKVEELSVNGEETEGFEENNNKEDTQDVVVEDKIGKIQISAKAISPSAIQVDNVSVARDIAGLKFFYKDDSIVVTWTDTSCGNVVVSVINANNMQILDTKTVEGKSYEFEIPDLVKEIVVKVVPSVSTHVEGAEIQYTKEVINNPNATVEYENKEYVNTESIPVKVKLNQPYKVLFEVNGKEVKKTEELKAGVHDYQIPITEGNNKVLTYIVDEEGNMRSTKHEVIRDSIKPILNIDMDYDGLSTYEDIGVFTGSVKDYETFMVNDTVPVIAGDGSFKVDYVLRDGENRIVMKATDIAGNETIYEATVYKLIKEIPYHLYISLGTGCVLLIAALIRFVYAKKKGIPFIPDVKKKERVPKTEKSTKEVKKSMKKWQREMLVDSIFFIAIIIIMRTVLLVGNVPSASMEPTLDTGNIAFVNGLAYVKNEPQRGDIIVFDSEELNCRLIKRVIGLPGDMITFQDGYVYINGELVYEEYISKDIETNCNLSFTVPDNSYFVLGDNREHSLDSRYWDNPYVHEDVIKGKLLAQFPLAQLKQMCKDIIAEIRQ